MYPGEDEPPGSASASPLSPGFAGHGVRIADAAFGNLREEVWMRQLRTGAAFLAVWASALAAQGATPPGEPFGERVEVNVVNVEVYATDAGGRPAAGLQRSHLVLLEDGKPMEIRNLAAIDRH